VYSFALSLTLVLDMGGVVNAMPWALSPPLQEIDMIPIVQEARRAAGLVWMSAENLAPTRIRSLDCPACSESLY
jgi:hypothetical protein